MKSIIAWCKEHRSEIYSGVICTLITTAFFKGVDWLKNAVPAAGNSLALALSGEFYQKLASQSDTTIITLLFSTVFGVLIASMFFPILTAFAETKKGIKVAMKAVNLNETLKEMEEKYKRTDTENAPTATKEEELVREGKALLCKINKTRIRIVVILLLASLYFAWVFVYQIVPSFMWDVYQQDIIKITPYIEEYNLNMIRSDWVCMQTKADYDDIYARINMIKEKNNLP